MVKDNGLKQITARKTIHVDAPVKLYADAEANVKCSYNKYHHITEQRTFPMLHAMQL